jgi:UDP-glucose 4-epimerase
MSTERARTELGWQPHTDAATTLAELLAGLRAHAGGPTPPLDADRESGPLRTHEVANLAGLRQTP